MKHNILIVFLFLSIVSFGQDKNKILTICTFHFHLVQPQFGVEFDIIKKSGSWFSYGESKLAQGRDAVKQILTDNPELAEEIEAKIREALKSVTD